MNGRIAAAPADSKATDPEITIREFLIRDCELEREHDAALELARRIVSVAWAGSQLINDLDCGLDDRNSQRADCLSDFFNLMRETATRVEEHLCTIHRLQGR